MKPVIPDYEWITYGERVNSYLIFNHFYNRMGCKYPALTDETYQQNTVDFVRLLAAQGDWQWR
jgi:hypothetical protein